MTETSPAADQGAQIKRLQQRVGALEWQQSQLIAISALGALLVSGATLLVIGLALPWMERESGWAVFTAEGVGVVALLAMAALLVLTVATAVGRSVKSHVATLVLAGLCGLLPVLLILSSLREGSTIDPGAGCYTILLGSLAIAVAAGARRSKIESLK